MAWQFERKGVIMRATSGVDEDELMLAAADAGAEDVADRRRHLAGHHPADRPARGAHRARGGRARDRVRRPHDAADHHASRSSEDEASKSVLRLIDALEDHDDVQAVYANFDIPDAVLEAVISKPGV